MPTYDYLCAMCGDFDALRPISQRNDPVPCPGCGACAPRILANAPGLALMAADTRQAVAINERARHQPKHSAGQAQRKHPSGCGCCSGVQRGATATAPNGNKAFPGKRPWMISH